MDDGYVLTCDCGGQKYIIGKENIKCGNCNSPFIRTRLTKLIQEQIDKHEPFKMKKQRAG